MIQGRLEILENDVEVVVKRAKRRAKPRGLQISEGKLLGNPEVLQSRMSGIQPSSSSQAQGTSKVECSSSPKIGPKVRVGVTSFCTQIYLVEEVTTDSFS